MSKFKYRDRVIIKNNITHGGFFEGQRGILINIDLNTRTGDPVYKIYLGESVEIYLPEQELVPETNN